MKLELYQEIALLRNFPEKNLLTGDVATLVDFVPHPDGQEQGAVLEIFSAVGDSLKVVVVPSAYFSYRSFAGGSNACCALIVSDDMRLDNACSRVVRSISRLNRGVPVHTIWGSSCHSHT